MEKLHPKAVWLFFAQFIILGIIPFFVFVFFAAQLIVGRVASKLIGEIGDGAGEPISTAWMFGMVVIPLLIFLLYLVLCFIWARLTYRCWKYELTENALKIEKGVIWKKYISIPYERIQNVDIYRGLLVRILGLSNLQIQTAGYSGVYAARGRGFGFGAEGFLPGLAPEMAEGLREDLVQKVKGAKQNQGL